MSEIKKIIQEINTVAKDVTNKTPKIKHDVKKFAHRFLQDDNADNRLEQVMAVMIATAGLMTKDRSLINLARKISGN